MVWKVKLYMDGSLPFGLRSALKLFTALADGLGCCGYWGATVLQSHFIIFTTSSYLEQVLASNFQMHCRHLCCFERFWGFQKPTARSKVLELCRSGDTDQRSSVHIEAASGQTPVPEANHSAVAGEKELSTGCTETNL